MLDRIHLFVPFKLEHVTLLSKETREEPVHVLTDGIESLGVPLAAQITIDEETGEHQTDYLRHCWESLGTGFTPMAMKVFHESMGKRAMPGIELKCSPAKLLQGHNVFGPTSIATGAMEMWRWLGTAYPKLTERLDLEKAEVYDIDCTYSARLPDERTCLQAIQAIRGVSNGQTKGRGDDYQTTAYFGAKDSRLRKLKLYLKAPEFDRQLEEVKRARRGDIAAARTLKVMSQPRLIQWSRNLLRIEATVAKRWLNRRGIPNRLVDLVKYQEDLEAQGQCFIQWCWSEVTKELFAAFEGQTMRVIDDEAVLSALKEKHVRLSKNGTPSYTVALSLFRTYRSIKDYGWQETMDSMSRPTFYRHVQAITESGLSKAALQKLNEHDRKSNVVPLLRFLHVDFQAQRPDWYVEPKVA